MTVKLYGTHKLFAAIAEKRELALYAVQEFAKIPGMMFNTITAHLCMSHSAGINIVAKPQLSLFAFQVNWPGSSRQQRNTATMELLDRVLKRGKVVLSGCEISGDYYGRVCILGFRTHKDYVDLCIQQAREETAEILKPTYSYVN